MSSAALVRFVQTLRDIIRPACATSSRCAATSTGFDAPMKRLPGEIDRRRTRRRCHRMGFEASVELIRSASQFSYLLHDIEISEAEGRRRRHARLLSSFSTIRLTFAFSTSPRPRASTCRSCPASFPCRISSMRNFAGGLGERAPMARRPFRRPRGRSHDTPPVAAAVGAEQVIDRSTMASRNCTSTP